MAIKLYKEPGLERPDLIACWPGIGNIGLVAVDVLRSQIGAEELGEIEPYDFFYPKKVIIRASLLQDLEFPTNKFYYKRLATKDLIFFVGEEQPSQGAGMYAGGVKAYQMANLVLDVAEKFGCRRIYTSGAAVAPTHHSLRPRVWAVTSKEDVNREVKTYENTVLMGEIEGSGRQGSITGLNGLLLGIAKNRGVEAVCLMGEIPDYLSGIPFPYPGASKVVLEVLGAMLGIAIDFTPIDAMAAQIDKVIGSVYERFPPEIRERIDQRKSAVQAKAETITEEDENWIKEHIDELFKRGDKGGERPS